VRSTIVSPVCSPPPPSFWDAWLDPTVVGDRVLVGEAVRAALPVAEDLDWFPVDKLAGDSLPSSSRLSDAGWAHEVSAVLEHGAAWRKRLGSSGFEGASVVVRFFATSDFSVNGLRDEVGEALVVLEVLGRFVGCPRRIALGSMHVHAHGRLLGGADSGTRRF